MKLVQFPITRALISLATAIAFGLTFFVMPMETAQADGGGGGGGGGGGDDAGSFWCPASNPSCDSDEIGAKKKKKPPPKKVYRKPKGKKKAAHKHKSVQPPVVKTIPQFVPNEVLVLVTSDQPDALGDALAVTFNLTKVETVPVALLEGSIIRFRYSDNRPLSNVITAITTDARVFQAQPNNYYQLAGKKKRSRDPSNSDFQQLKLASNHHDPFNLLDLEEPKKVSKPKPKKKVTKKKKYKPKKKTTTKIAVKKKRSKKSNTQYSLVKLSVGPAHQISKGRDVSVAVIDTGINIWHPSLSKAVISSFDAVSEGKITVNKHGTAIAGLIAGQGRVQGIAPLSRLLAVRAFYMHREYNKSTTNSMILLRALDWSFANEARIFNMSFAGPFDPLVKRALENAYNKGVILVAAGGNGGPKAAPAYPAAYENVIAITALDHKDKLYAHANHGSYLTAAAPGVDVLVPSLKKSYSYSSGTSMAAAHISGLIALLLERHPDATSEAIVDAIKKSAHDLGPKGYDTQFGAGRADALASLKLLAASQ